MKMKSLKEKIKFATKCFCAGLVMAFATPFTAFASTGVSTVDTAMNNLKILAIGIVSTIGVLVLVKGGMDLGSAFKERDSSGMSTAAGELIGGFIMAAIGAVIAFLGF